MANPTYTITNHPTQFNATTTYSDLGDHNGFTILAHGTGAAPTTAGQFQHGAWYIRTDTSTGSVALYQNEGSTAVPSWKLLMSSSTPVSALGVNYIGTESGSNNALVATLADGAGTNVTVAAGLRVLLKSAHTLQAGANTFNLNGHGTDAIVSQAATNLKTIYAAGAMLDMTFDGTNWQLMNSST